MRVIVVGAGILGASTAYHLAREGCDVTLIDRADEGRATAAGAGIAVLPAFIADEDASLRRVLPELPQANLTRTFWMSMPAENKQLARMQTVWGFLRETVESQRAVFI